MYKCIHGGEYHMYNPDVIATRQKAVKIGEYAVYQIYATHENTRPVATIRDLFKLKDATPIPLDELESVETILKRFDSAGLSPGALSPAAHEALAIPLHRLVARSTSGHGGEDPARYSPAQVSKIK